MDTRGTITIDQVMAGETGEIILLYEQKSECDRVRSEAQERASALNRLASYGITWDMLRNLSSIGQIDNHIEAKLREENPDYAYQLSKRLDVKAHPSPELARTRDHLYHWVTWKENGMSRSHAASLSFTDGKWIVDSEAIERLLVSNGYRKYLPEHRRGEFDDCVVQCRLLVKYNRAASQVKETFLNEQIEPAPDSTINSPRYQPRWYFFDR